jgi:hypothetical protein
MSLPRALLGALFFSPIVLTGCMGARYVSLEPQSGIVAIPMNTNCWPCYFHDKAEALMKEKCPQGYVIDHEEEVVVKTTRETETNKDTHGNVILAVAGLDKIRETTRETTSSHDETEWRIWFRAANVAGRGAGQPPAPTGAAGLSSTNAKPGPAGSAGPEAR